MNNYLIIGGFGFLGKHFIEYVQKYDSNANFTVLTRSVPTVEWSVYNYVLAEDLSESVIKGLAHTHNVVVHMATSSVPGASSMVNELETNVLRTTTLIAKLNEYRCDIRYVFLSSGGQVYGNRQLDKIPETAELNPMSPYGFGKIMIEQSLKYLATNFGTSIGILRVGNPIGRWQSGTRQGIVNVAIESLRADRAIPVFGSGSELRDYLDADAVAEAIFKAVNIKSSFDVWNIGSGVGTRTIDIINIVAETLGKNAKFDFQPRRAVDPETIVLDCTHAKRTLDWEANLELHDLVRKTVIAKTRRVV